MSEKSLRRSWISQFGLYRYDDNLKRHKRECSICFYGITGTASIIIITVFLFITNTDFQPPKRIIILSHENKSLHNQLSTASVFMQQIPTNFEIDSEISITTPLSVKMFYNQRTHHLEDPEAQPQTLEFKAFPKINNEAGFYQNHNIHPNHRYSVRRQLEDVNEPRPFDYIIRGTPPTAFQRTHENSSSFPQIPKEYVGTVNSIQDILKQVSDNGDDSHQQSNGLHKIKIAGTYKHRKADDIAGMFESATRKNRGHIINDPVIPVVDSHPGKTNKVIRDPFYRYKPNPLSEVNLMAMNQFRFAPYNILSNKYVPTSSSHPPSMDPGNLYHQIIMANKNRLKYSDDNSKAETVQSKQRPFTLMLDVYPMPDDEHTSSAVPKPVKYQNHLYSHAMRYPSISSINNLQPNIYSQMKANRYPNLPHYSNPNYFRKYGSKPINSGIYSSNDRDSSGNNPSQITVHLNLFPKKKERSDDHNQNAEMFNKNDELTQEEGERHAISSRLRDRMVKLVNNINKTGEQKDFNSKETINSENVSNKVDMDMLRSTTVSSPKQNVFMVDDGSDEDIFSKEFLQFQSTHSPIEFESKSDDSPQLNLIPTIIPIEPREYNHQLDKKLLSVQR